MNAWQTRTPEYNRGGIRCLGGVSIPCRTAFDLMTDCMDKPDRYIDHRICEMLPSNAIVEILATTTYL